MESKEIITNALDRRNLSMTDLVKLMCDNDHPTSYSNLYNKLKRDSMKCSEIVSILELLDFEVRLVDKRIDGVGDPQTLNSKGDFLSMVVREQEKYIESIVLKHIDLSLQKLKSGTSQDLSIILDILKRGTESPY